MRWLIVTDLDGTLLDDSYPQAEAARAVDEIQAVRPDTRVVLASSKTLAEMLAIAQRTVTRPFLIFENGGGVAWPSDNLLRTGETHVDGYQVELLTAGHAVLYKLIRRIRRLGGYRFRGLSELTADEIVHLTGLEPEDAELARQRLTSEPLSWEDDAAALARFETALQEAGLTLQRGGRFHHVSFGASKGRALDHLRRQIRDELGDDPLVLACGDAPNDLEMIDRADRALLFPGRDGTYLRAPSATVTHAPMAGPAHWLAGVNHIINAQQQEAAHE